MSVCGSGGGRVEECWCDSGGPAVRIGVWKASEGGLTRGLKLRVPEGKRQISDFRRCKKQSF